MTDSTAQKTYGIFANPNARKIIAELGNANADVRLFPSIEIEKIVLDERSIEVLFNLNDFDWLIFTDVLAVDFFLENLAENAIDLFELDNLRICAVGETVSDRLRFSSIHSDVVPANFSLENLLTAIGDYTGAETLKTLNFLFPKGKSTDENLLEKLREKVFLIKELPMYAAHLTNNLETAKLKTLLTNGAIDEFVFTAPADFIALKYILKNADFSNIFAETKISAGDTATAQTARENNLSAVNLFFTAKT